MVGVSAGRKTNTSGDKVRPKGQAIVVVNKNRNELVGFDRGFDQKHFRKNRVLLHPANRVGLTGGMIHLLTLCFAAGTGTFVGGTRHLGGHGAEVSVHPANIRRSQPHKARRYEADVMENFLHKAVQYSN